MAPNFDTTTGALSESPRKCVLLVEDELLIRMIVSDELREAQYDVIEAINGDEALTILTSPVHIDAIVSDVHMPGSIDGIGVLDAARELFPHVPVIIISGHFGREEAMARGAYEFLRKPFAVEGVVNAVSYALSPPDDGPTCP